MKPWLIKLNGHLKDFVLDAYDPHAALLVAERFASNHNFHSINDAIACLEKCQLVNTSSISRLEDYSHSKIHVSTEKTGVGNV